MWQKDLNLVRKFIEKEDLSNEAINDVFGTRFGSTSNGNRFGKSRNVKHPLGGTIDVALSNVVGAESPFKGSCSPITVRKKVDGAKGMRSGGESVFNTWLLSYPLKAPSFDGGARVIRSNRPANGTFFLVLPRVNSDLDYERKGLLKFGSPIDNKYRVEQTRAYGDFMDLNGNQRWRDLKWSSLAMQKDTDDFVSNWPNWRIVPNMTGEQLLHQADTIMANVKVYQTEYGPADAENVRTTAKRYYYELQYLGKKGIWRVFQSQVAANRHEDSPEGTSCFERVVSFHPHKTNNGNTTDSRAKTFDALLEIVAAPAISIGNSTIGAQKIFQIEQLEPIFGREGDILFAIKNPDLARGTSSAFGASRVAITDRCLQWVSGARPKNVKHPSIYRPFTDKCKDTAGIYAYFAFDKPSVESPCIPKSKVLSSLKKIPRIQLNIKSNVRNPFNLAEVFGRTGAIDLDDVPVYTEKWQKLSNSEVSPQRKGQTGSTLWFQGECLARIDLVSKYQRNHSR